MIHPERVHMLRDGNPGRGPVVYWMSRDQRIKDNWALLYAQSRAIQLKRPLVVVFCLVPHFLEATIRQYSFMLKGLQQVDEGLARKEILFFLLAGAPEKVVTEFVLTSEAAALVTDFDPLRIKREWKSKVSKRIRCPMYEVDAHNIVPAWKASQKQEYAAYTFRPKIRRLLPEFLLPFPNVRKHPFTSSIKPKTISWTRIIKNLAIDRSVLEVAWILPGERAAMRKLRAFMRDKLSLYARDRNDPLQDVQSGLSVYLHFGQISAQRVALEIRKSHADYQSKEAFLEELVVRKELSDNFCFYNKDYDSFNGFPAWAQKTLNRHRKDRRNYVYSAKQLESAKTHDDLWNAAQMEMVTCGRMHGFLRMYWAKKILEWTASPEDALEAAIYLNDRYELDGRDPNGYTGIAWSIGGVHDRAWNERPVFGKIRYMSYNGCKSKFNINEYIRQAGRQTA